jgi:hypothetical protein
MKQQVSPAVAGVILAIVIVVAVFFLYRSIGGPPGPSGINSVGNPGPFAPGGAGNAGMSRPQGGTPGGGLTPPGSAR